MRFLERFGERPIPLPRREWEAEHDFLHFGVGRVDLRYKYVFDVEGWWICRDGIGVADHEWPDI